MPQTGKKRACEVTNGRDCSRFGVMRELTLLLTDVSVYRGIETFLVLENKNAFIVVDCSAVNPDLSGIGITRFPGSENVL